MRLTVVIDCSDPAALLPFWTSALGYREAAAPSGYAALVPPERDGRPVVLLRPCPSPSR